MRNEKQIKNHEKYNIKMEDILWIKNNLTKSVHKLFHFYKKNLYLL